MAQLRRHPSDLQTVDRFEKKVIFDIGGNKFRLIAIIDFELQRLFVRAVMDHKEYDQEKWKNDTFGDDWNPIRKKKRQA